MKNVPTAAVLCLSLFQLQYATPCIVIWVFRTSLHLQELQTLILINCGATEDIAKLLDLTPYIRVIVIDSHRPFHHNLNDDTNRTFMAFCNRADGTCDDVPEPQFSGSVPLQLLCLHRKSVAQLQYQLLHLMQLLCLPRLSVA